MKYLCLCFRYSTIANAIPLLSLLSDITVVVHSHCSYGSSYHQAKRGMMFGLSFTTRTETTRSVTLGPCGSEQQFATKFAVSPLKTMTCHCRSTKKFSEISAQDSFYSHVAGEVSGGACLAGLPCHLL